MSHTADIDIISIDCWHANELIYQADGETDDGRHIYIRYRRPYFSLGIGFTPDEAPGNDVIATDAHPDHDPSTITLTTLRAWANEARPDLRIVWPDHIDGFSNEPGSHPLRPG